MSIQAYLIAALVALFAGLGVTIEIQHLRLSALKSDLIAVQAKVDICLAENHGFADQVRRLTEDAAQAQQRAEAATASFEAFKRDEDQRLVDQVKEINRAAQPSDDVESPVLRNALRLLRHPVPASH